MRHAEWTSGVAVRTADGEAAGRSRIAGAFGVSACILGRVGAAAPILLLPPMLQEAMERRSPWVAARPLASAAVLLAAVAACIQVSVPLTFGLFKQTAHRARPATYWRVLTPPAVPSSLLEEEVAARAPAQDVYFNKGI